MDAQYYAELASRWVSGDRLTASEQQQLLQWLNNYPEARAELLADEDMDSLLHCLPHEDGAEGFVQNCLRRLVASPADRSDRIARPLAPPIAAPPVVVPRPPLSGPRRRGRSFPLYGARRWMAAAACCSAALLVAAIGWRWLPRGPHPLEASRSTAPLQDVPTPAPADGKHAQPAGERTFAMLAKTAGATWEMPRAEGDRLAAGTLNLTAGTAELHFDRGTIVRLTAPVVLELRGEDEVFLQSGSVSAQVPPPAVGFAVVTALSRVVDLGTEFDVTADETGATQTLVRQGRVLLTPQRGEEEPAAPIELTAAGLNRAEVSVPDVAAPLLPVIAVARGSEGRFLGQMSTNGKTVEFHSPEALREFQTMAMEQLHTAPAQFGSRWPALTASVERESSAPPPTAQVDRENPASKAPVAATAAAGGGRTIAAAGMVPGGRSFAVHENGKTFWITDNKDSGITITITETVGGKRNTTQVNAADAADLARKNPDVHHMYRKYFHPRPKGGRGK
jgi:hypothetical protein